MIGLSPNMLLTHLQKWLKQDKPTQKSKVPQELTPLKLAKYDWMLLYLNGSEREAFWWNNDDGIDGQGIVVVVDYQKSHEWAQNLKSCQEARRRKWFEINL